MAPSIYSAMIGSISSPILNSTTRGRAAELEAPLVCAFTREPQAKSSADIRAISCKAASIGDARFRMRRRDGKAGKEIEKKEGARGASGTASESARTRRQHIPAPLYQSARQAAG